MWFDSLAEIKEIARQNGTAVFVVPSGEKIEVAGAIVLEPREKTVISIEQVREIFAKTDLKMREDFFVVIRPAEKLGLDAANALLKNLEEPGANVHYILITESPSLILSTILSRAALYFWRDGEKFDLQIKASEKEKELAKQLIAASGADLVDIAEKLAKKKDGVREKTLQTLGLAIEIMEKSYFITGKKTFLDKLSRLLAAYDGVKANGNVKLQIVANLC